MSARKMKKPETPLRGESGLANQKARQLVWPRHYLWLVVDSDLVPAAVAAAAATPAVTSIALVVTTVAPPAAPPAPAAAAPAVSAWANTLGEKAANTRTNASFFIDAPLNYANTENRLLMPACEENYAGEKR
jgi:hypothetical protein